jgi:hypothetical protein
MHYGCGITYQLFISVRTIGEQIDMGFLKNIKQSIANSQEASKERAAQRAVAEEARAQEANERNEQQKGYGSRERADEYWAVIDRSSGLSGELPDIKYSKVYASNDTELEDKLSEFIDKAVEESKQYSRPLPKKSTYFEIKERYPNKEIFKVDSEAIQEMLGIPDDQFHRRRHRGKYGPGRHNDPGMNASTDLGSQILYSNVLQPAGYFAIIEMKGNTWYGEVPGFTMMRAIGSPTMDACVQDLTKQLTDQLKHTAPSRWPPKKTYDELAKMHLTQMSSKSIVQIIAQL